MDPRDLFIRGRAAAIEFIRFRGRNDRGRCCTHAWSSWGAYGPMSRSMVSMSSAVSSGTVPSSTPQPLLLTAGTRGSTRTRLRWAPAAICRAVSCEPLSTMHTNPSHCPRKRLTPLDANALSLSVPAHRKGFTSAT